MKIEDVKVFVDVILSVKISIKLCKVCCNFIEDEVCFICKDEKRDRSIICVVEEL